MFVNEQEGEREKRFERGESAVPPPFGVVCIEGGGGGGRGFNGGLLSPANPADSPS